MFKTPRQLKSIALKNTYSTQAAPQPLHFRTACMESHLVFVVVVGFPGLPSEELLRLLHCSLRFITLTDYSGYIHGALNKLSQATVTVTALFLAWGSTALRRAP